MSNPHDQAPNAWVLERIAGSLDRITHLMVQSSERERLAAEENRRTAQQNLEAARINTGKRIPALPDLYVPDPCLSVDGHRYEAKKGQNLRMEHSDSGCSLILELPISHFDKGTGLLGYKLANGTEMIFGYRLTSHGKALFEWLPLPSARIEELDQQVVWLGGPLPVLGDDK